MFKTIILIILTLINVYLLGWSIEEDKTALGMTSIIGFIIFGFWLLLTVVGG